METQPREVRQGQDLQASWLEAVRTAERWLDGDHESTNYHAFLHCWAMGRRCEAWRWSLIRGWELLGVCLLCLSLLPSSPPACFLPSQGHDNTTSWCELKFPKCLSSCKLFASWNVTRMGCQEFELHLNLIGVHEWSSTSINPGKFECLHYCLNGHVEEASQKHQEMIRDLCTNPGEGSIGSKHDQQS